MLPDGGFMTFSRALSFSRTIAGLTPLLVLLLGHRAVAAGTSVTIADYPRYGTNVAALDPRVQTDLRLFASGLVGAVLAGQSVDVTVIGHADFDAQGRAFEVGVSRERAAGAESALEAFFSQAADAALLPPDKRKLVRFSAIGVGTQRPVFAPPANEEQRKANRRVDLVFTTTPVPPPDPLAKYRECLRVLGSAGPPGPVRRMSCVCNKLLQPAPAAKDYFYDFQAARQARAGAGAMSQFTPDQMSAFYRTFMLFTRHSIAQISPASDADLTNGLIQLDDSIGRNLTDFLAQAEQGAGPFEHSVSVDIVKRMQDPNHTYSCYAGYSRRDPNR
jgi:hypothetical protein